MKMSKAIYQKEGKNLIKQSYSESSAVKDKLKILKANFNSNQPFKIESKTKTLNNPSSWSNREGEWFLAEKRLLFSTKKANDLEDWMYSLKQVFLV